MILHFSVSIKSKLKLLPLMVVICSMACRKSDRDFDKDTSGSIEYLTVEKNLYNIFRLTQEAAFTTAGISSLQPGFQNTGWADCDTFYTDTISSTKMMVFDFKNGCYYLDRHFKGKMIVLTSGKWPQQGQKMEISFQDFYTDNILWGEKFEILCMGQNSSGNWIMRIQNNDSLILHKDQRAFFLFPNYTVLHNTNNTPVFSDDKWTYTGTNQGRLFNGAPFQAEITDSINLNYDCTHFLTGNVHLRQGNLSLREIATGQGECDNSATVKINGVNYLVIY
jgi:hypothetical protein